MKKSFFQKTYNLNINLIILILLLLLLKFALLLLENQLGNIEIESLQSSISFVQDKLNFIAYFVQSLTLTLTSILVLSICTELFQRFTKDSILNYFKSIYQTIRLRQFLKQDEMSESIISIDNQTTVTKFNPILKNFNHAISSCTVDIRQDTLSVFIKYPRTQQAQKLLRDMEGHVKEEISGQNPEYYFSSSIREGNKLWYIGTRR
ncbi:TPA: hypothetical protein U1X08_001344 [Streptococcus suis]|uniref:Membrane protein n=2 Tax=Streptococcus suis TaxID=1307 RepID=A0A0Z8JT89_STRSU|nr:hypothetical protein [Streptococcus suis]AXI64891.1 hypothetical protein DP111_02110 [Streptococcus suis]MBO8110652.1 hypothetical protein [Streptococcus suis]MBS8089776.1 hypothetical protein [Streptococcus suis]MCB2852413.1 hypothetical protein [Streptococcus suis]MCB2858157.1 hypothetical protein [Streptococcus suis]